MIIPKHYHRKRRDKDWNPDLSMYNTQASSFLKLQQEGKQKIAHKEKSTLESLLPLVAASLTPFALQAQASCPNNNGMVIQGCTVPVNRVTQEMDLDGDGNVDLNVFSEFTNTNSAFVGFVGSAATSGVTWLNGGYLKTNSYGTYSYFSAYATGAAISAANMVSPQSYARNSCTDSYYQAYIDYDSNGTLPPSTTDWNNEVGTTGLYMSFSKNGLLGFVEIIYDDTDNSIVIGNYGIACDASIMSIVAGDCSSLVAGPAVALTVEITEDTNNDGTIDAAENIGDVDILATFTGPVAAGDMLVIDDGINPPFTITLTATDVAAGSVSTTVPLPPDGTTLIVTATLNSSCSTGTDNDVVVINIPPPIVNNDCDDAITLPVGLGACAGTILASNNTNATDSGETPAPSCGNYQGSDQWFQLIVPPSGNVTIETYINGANAFQDSAISVYSGTCNGGLVEIACDDDSSNNPGFFSLLELTGQTPGNTLYIRAWEYGNEANAKGDFLICAWDPTVNTCPDLSAATGTPLTGPQTTDEDFESDNQIDSDQIIDAPATKVDYDSAVSVQMMQGFEVKGGVVFHAFIDGCGGAQ